MAEHLYEEGRTPRARMVLRLLLVRHAESENNELMRLFGAERYKQERKDDPGITDLGRQQAEYVGQHIDKHSRGAERRVMSSAMKRALHTAMAIASVGEMPLHIDTALHEVGGSWVYQDDGKVSTKGATREQVLSDCPKASIPATLTSEGWFMSDHVETAQEAEARAATIAKRYLDEATARAAATETPLDAAPPVVVAVSHGDFLAKLISAITDAGPNVRFDTFNCSITEVSYWSNPQREGVQTSVLYVNSISHLPKTAAVAFVYS